MEETQTYQAKKKVNGKRPPFKSKTATKSLSYKTPVESEAAKPIYGNPYQWQIVPFYGKDNNFPKFLYDVATMSPTVSAARLWKSKYTIGDGLKINTGEALDMFAELQDEPKAVSSELQSSIVQFAKAKNGNGENLLQFINRLLSEFLDTGNMVVVFRKFKVGNETRFTYWAENMSHSRLLMTKEGEPAEFMAIDPRFKYGGASIDQQFSKVYPLYPIFNNDGYTVIHVKNLVGGRIDYGLPSGFSSIHHQIGEAKSPEFVNQLIDNRFVAAGFIEVVEHEDPTQQETNNLHKNLVGRWSNQGSGEKDPFGLRVVSDKEYFSKVHEFSNNVDVDFLERNSAENETKIISSEQWHPLFMGKPTKAGLGGYKDELRQLYLQLKAVVYSTATERSNGNCEHAFNGNGFRKCLPDTGRLCNTERG